MSPPSSMQLFERLASAVVIGDSNDVASLSHILSLLEQLVALWSSEKQEQLVSLAQPSVTDLKALIDGTADHRPTRFNAVCAAVSALQAAIRNDARRKPQEKTSVPEESSSPEGNKEISATPFQIVIPMEVTEEASAHSSAPETSNESAPTQALETPVEPPPPAAEVAPPSPEAPAAAPTPTPAPAETTALRRLERDAETLELIGDFLQEGEAGLSQADDILMAAEKGGLNADKINALFRVFHSIKGVSGFLELSEVTSLTHTTENLLNAVRDGELALEGAALDVVFDATAMTRTLLNDVRKSAESNLEFGSNPGLRALIARIEAITQGAATAQAAAPAAPTPVLVSAPAPAPVAAPVVAAVPSQPVAVSPAEMEDSAPGSTPSSGEPAKLRETVKVDLERIDQMVEMIGELIIVESMVVHAPEIAALPSLPLRRHLSQLTKISRDLQDVGMRMRMVPVRGVFQKAARLVRELARKTGKNVVLVPSGDTTEMDRSMVERIEDPLVHLIRNAVDHGIEDPEERGKTSKKKEATIRLSAYHEGGSVVIEIADDGRGLNRKKILAKARAQKLVREDEALTDAEVQNLIFAPGFSTASQVTEISGRGVGMDVVKRNVEAMRGRVSIDSVEGKGTTFRLTLPLTLAIIDGMVIVCGQERYIIPSLSIVESLKPSKSMISTFAERDELINVRGEILPLLRLSKLFQVEKAKTDATQALAVVVEGMGKTFGLLVDDVVTQQQVVIKPLSSALDQAEYYSGAAILSDGRVGLILNIDRISTLIKRSGMQRFAQEKVA